MTHGAKLAQEAFELVIRLELARKAEAGPLHLGMTIARAHKWGNTIRRAHARMNRRNTVAFGQWVKPH